MTLKLNIELWGVLIKRVLRGNFCSYTKLLMTTL